MIDPNSSFDVAIIGGGPAGSTVGCLLKKYNPELTVGIFERETFPRDHVGESLLPPVCHVMNEMGCWDKVEAANFPVKIGGSYRWGKVPELWHLNFVPPSMYEDLPRPGKFEGLRQHTAFQVDRSIYDKILLDHASELGCEVQEATKISGIIREGDRVTVVKLATGGEVTARYYVDASGTSGAVRRAMDVQVEHPSTLQNIAIYDYWQNADWAVEIGVGGTRIQVLSLPYGWIWFIPLGPTRTSIGLVIPTEYYKRSGKRPEELYNDAIADEQTVSKLLRNAISEGKLQTTRDWSFLSDRQYGENWFLVGDCAGFADPILSAGLSLSQSSARQLAYTILELIRGDRNSEWLKEQFEVRQTRRIRNHIRFADYWYCANAQLIDLKQFTVSLAKDNGLDLSPERAWEWIAAGGFIQEGGRPGTGAFTLSQVKSLGEFLSETTPQTGLDKANVFTLDLKGASSQVGAHYENGRVIEIQTYIRGERILPIHGPCALVVDILQTDSSLQAIIGRLRAATEKYRSDPEQRTQILHAAVQTLDALVSDGWVEASYDPSRPLEDLTFASTAIQWDHEVQRVDK